MWLSPIVIRSVIAYQIVMRCSKRQAFPKLINAVYITEKLETCSILTSALASAFPYDLLSYNPIYCVLEGWRAAITVGTNDSSLTRLSNR